MTFRTRTFLVLLTLIIMVEGTTFIAVLNATRSNFIEQGARELSLGRVIFDNAIDSRASEVAVAVGVLASDFGFKGVVATGDEATIRSALINHGSRINADLTFLIGRDGKVRATSHELPALAFGSPFPFEALLETGRSRSEPARAVVSVGDSAMQLVVAPVRAPDLIGWVAVGFAIDDVLAQRIEGLTNLQVSFVEIRGNDTRVLASTLAEDDRAGLASATTLADVVSDPRVIELGGQPMLGLRHHLSTGPDYNLDVVLGLPMDEVLAGYAPLRMKLIGIMILALALSAFGARLLARTVSQPLKGLAEAARRISRGNYRETVAVGSDDEIGTLAQAFNNMQQGIRNREEQIVFQSQHDALTGLPNRTLVNDRLHQSIRRSQRSARPFSVLMLDLNGFKDINDTLGHATGDQVLVQVASRLERIGRDCDTVARLGGDEFLILLEDTDLAGARTTAERLVDSIGATVAVQSMQIRAHISVGIACFPIHGQSAEEILRRADIAMYTAKDSDQHIAEYQVGQDEDHLRRLALVNDLRDALDNDELKLYYQPKMDLRTGTVTAVEALVRWPHPMHGMIPPDEFVPLAEQSGYIRALTHAVLVKALSQVQRWRNDGLAMNISINLSALDLLDEKLPDIVQGLLSRYSLTGAVLTLEITESAVMKDTAYARGVMERLREQGIKLSIDDFGTGHASLAQLKRLPVDELKIDKSFVMDLPASLDDAAIVRSTIELGHNMGLSVTAEGVETDQSRNMLTEFNCDVIQGYLLSKPLPEDEFVLWIRGRHAAAVTAAQRVVTNDDLEDTGARSLQSA